TLIGRMPGRARVFAPSCAATRCLIRPARDTRVPGERMDVALRARAMVLPGRAAVDRAHQSAELDPSQDDARVVRARGDPADVRGPRARRKAPGRTRRQLEQTLELTPALPSVAAEQPTWLGARVHRGIRCAHRERAHTDARS